MADMETPKEGTDSGAQGAGHDEGFEIKSNKMPDFRRAKDDAVDLGGEAINRGLDFIDSMRAELGGGFKSIREGVSQPLKFAKAVYEQTKQGAEIREALEASELAADIMSSPVVSIKHVAEMDGSPVAASVEKVYGVETQLKSDKFTIAVGVMEGKHFILYAEDSPLRIYRGREGFDSIEAYGSALVGKSGGATCLIDPIEGGKSAEINLKIT